MEKCYYTYIMANKPNGTLYVGMTSDIVNRAYQHRTGLIPGFTKKYNIKSLVYYEIHQYPSEAIQREKRIKKWNRKVKISLIESQNPTWRDLYEDFSGC